ncbi:Inhibitor of apoptosis-promoting Bax1 [Nakaseomyces glabratus]
MSVNKNSYVPLPNESAPPPYQEEDPAPNLYNVPDDFKWSTNVSACEPLVRQQFLHRVYSILSTQLLATLSMGYLTYKWEPLREFTNSNTWLVILAFIGSILTCIWLAFAPSVDDYVPEDEANYTGETETNNELRPAKAPWYYLSKRGQYAVLSVFTICEAYSLSTITLAYDPQIILSAVLITTVVIVGVSLVALSERFQFLTESATTIYFWLNWGLLLLFGMVLTGVFFGFSSKMNIFYAWFGAALFTIYLLMDTQMIFRKVRPDEEVKCAMILYVDIINLFLHILRILSSRENE